MDKQIIEQDLRVRKARLDKSRADLKQAIMERVGDLKSDVKKWGTIALIGLGTIYITYRVIRKATSTKSKESATAGNQPVLMNYSGESRIVSMIKEQIALFLFAIAKKKLLEYLQKSDLFNEENI